MRPSKSKLVKDITDAYLAGVTPPAAPLTGAQRLDIASDLLSHTSAQLQAQNALQQTGAKYRIPEDIYPEQVTACILKFERVACIRMNTTDKKALQLGVYQYEGDQKGLYALDTSVIENIVSQYVTRFSSKEIAEVVAQLIRNAPVVSRTMDKNLVPVNNGIFDFGTKTLLDFSPDYVFLSKSAVDYNPSASNAVIHNPDDGTDWDVESCL